MAETMQSLTLKLSKAERQILATVCRLDLRTQKDEVMWLMNRRLEELAKHGNTQDPLPETD
jgi:hypothetical protein